MVIFNPLKKIDKGDVKKETAAKIINLLNGFTYRDSKIILEMVNGALGYYLTVNAPYFEQEDCKPAQ